MKKITIVLAIFMGCLFLGAVNADEMLIGSWETKEGERIDIIDGFKPNIGPVIQYDDGEVVGVYTWRIDPSSAELTIRYSSGPYTVSDTGTNLQWDSSRWTKLKSFKTKGIVNLKTDANGFIDGLTRHSWTENSDTAGQMEFTRTFSSTEGIVAQFDREESLEALSSWGVASGALKIGGYVYLEARITPQFLIGVDDDDDFMVLNKGEERSEGLQATMLESREEFLSAVTTGAWRTPGGYSEDSIYRFRPIEGDLKGRRFWEQGTELEGTSVWEFSPATGAFKIGYYEYIAAMTVGNLLIFINEEGDQSSYLRDFSVEEKQFSTTDVKTIQVSERTVQDIANVISRELSYENQYTLFEFNEDGRTGYVHEWRSYPFQITGQSLTTEGWQSFEQIHLIEDYVVFGEGYGRKIDLRQSRLKPKTDREAESDAERSTQELAELQEGRVSVRITRTDGSEATVPLPISSLSDLKSIAVIAE